MKTDPLIFVCARGSITQPSKVALRQAGVIVVETDNPADCRFVRGSVPIDSNALAAAAVASLATGEWKTSGGSMNSLGEANKIFMKALSEMLQAKQA